MSDFVEFLGPAVWRASWQAAAIALVVVVMLRLAGDRIAPRWRYLLWSVVLVRLMIIVTPASPWSAFNLVRWDSGESTAQLFDRDTATAIADLSSTPESQPDSPANVRSEPATGPARVAPSHNTSSSPPPIAEPTASPIAAAASLPPETRALRLLTFIWLAGCLLFALRWLLAAVVLHRRLSFCRPVSDTAVLEILEATRRQLGLKHAPGLLVSPESISPCVVGTWRPRIVVPESLVTEASALRLRHVLAHELAHLVRGDLWANWVLLAACVLHWFNPLAWLTIREMRAEREAACDELALAALGQTNRATYGQTLLDLATNMVSSTIAPGMIGLFSSTSRLTKRIERLAKSASPTALRTPVVVGLLLALGTFGLTDAIPRSTAEEPASPETQPDKTTTSPKEANDYTLDGRCIDQFDRTPLAGVRVRLFMATGRFALPVAVAQAVTDAEGKFKFEKLAPPRPFTPLGRRNYAVIAEAKGRPIGMGMQPVDAKETTVYISREPATLTGQVVNEQGEPVADATVAYFTLDGRTIPGVLSAKTDLDGRFAIPGMAARSPAELGRSGGVSLQITHPDFPETSAKAVAVPTNVVVTLAKGCTVSGMVQDIVTGRPAADAVVTLNNLQTYRDTLASTDDAGRFRVAVPEGRYNIKVEVPERVCVALADQDFATSLVKLPPFELVRGGFISGQVINTATGQPVTVSENGDAIAIGLIGPSQPLGRAIQPTPSATVDVEGRFTVRAAPGDNFPYFVNIRGNRMAWDTTKKPAVVVKDGETTTYNMTITPETPPAEKLKAAETTVAALPRPPQERTAAIVAEFRKLSHSVDETEFWCTFMRELVAIGPAAVPQLSAELDKTDDDRTLRRLGFALRAIGDPRAVPALIRALPKTMLHGGSDYGLNVNDPALTTFMQQYDLDSGKRGQYFDLGRARREIIGALHKLTGQDFDDRELFGLSNSSDPRRQALQRRLFVKQARRWQAWWEANWRTLTEDAAYQKVNLVAADEPLPPAPKSLGPGAKIADGEGVQGMVLSPAAQTGKHADHFLDLDTGRELQWPAQLERDEAKLDPKQIAIWASENGVDLMCVTHPSPHGAASYELKAFEMKVWEISPRDLRNLDKLVAAGTLPEGRAVGELLMHYDDALRQQVPAANGAFLYITREGCMGLIEITDRVIRTENLSGFAGDPTPGVGFHKGVRFNMKTIVP